MRIAFLFFEKYPNYDLDAILFSAISPDDSYQLDTYVRTGIWGLMHVGARNRLELEARIIEMLHHGNRKKIKSLKVLLEKSLSGDGYIYVILFNSIHPDLAEKIDDSLLRNSENYLGYTEVIPEGLHVIFFGNLLHRYKLKKRKIYTLFSEEHEDEFVANDIIDWIKNKYPLLQTKFAKMNIGWRFTLLDNNDADIVNDLRTQRTIQTITFEWEMIVESTVYTLLDAVPDATSEIASAFEVLRKNPITKEECAKASISLRRLFEKLAKTLDEEQNPKDDYRDQLKKYIQRRFQLVKPYQGYLEVELDEIFSRMNKVITLINKGIHEDWMSQAVMVLAMRSILTIKELLMPIKISKLIVDFNTAMFETDND
jgi:hypothetical protein